MADYENNENMNENEAENESGSNTIADAIGNIGAKVATAALTFGGIYVTKKLLDKAFSGKKPEESNASQATGEKVSLREKWARRKDAKAAERLRKRGHDVKTVTEQEETTEKSEE